MDQQVVEMILGQVGASGVAALALWIMRQWHTDSVKRRTEDAAEIQRRHERDMETMRGMMANETNRTDILLEALRNNTASNVRLIETVNSLRELMNGGK